MPRPVPPSLAAPTPRQLEEKQFSLSTTDNRRIANALGGRLNDDLIKQIETQILLFRVSARISDYNTPGEMRAALDELRKAALRYVKHARYGTKGKKAEQRREHARQNYEKQLKPFLDDASDRRTLTAIFRPEMNWNEIFHLTRENNQRPDVEASEIAMYCASYIERLDTLPSRVPSKRTQAIEFLVENLVRAFNGNPGDQDASTNRTRSLFSFVKEVFRAAEIKDHPERLRQILDCKLRAIK